MRHTGHAPGAALIAGSRPLAALGVNPRCVRRCIALEPMVEIGKGAHPMDAPLSVPVCAGTGRRRCHYDPPSRIAICPKRNINATIVIIATNSGPVNSARNSLWSYLRCM